MWIMSRSGFVSLVQHRDDPSLIRARARRLEHLTKTFDLTSLDVEDLGEEAPDYRWHADVSREKVIESLMAEVNDIDYESHAKEEMAGDDDVYYASLLRTWSAMLPLQAERGLRAG